jgi:anti-sigma factor RsiW
MSMTRNLDDALLVAYADGELDPCRLPEVEQALARDPEAQRKVRRMREIGVSLRAACPETRFQDVPDALIRLANRKPRAAHPVRRIIGYAAAASLVLMVFSGVDYTLNVLWKQQGAGAANGRDAMAEEIAAYHLVYSRETKHLVEVAADRRAELEAWFGDRLNRSLRVPDLTGQGLRFEGGRLLALNGQPVAELIYSRDKGAPIAVCVTFAETAEASFEIGHHHGIAVGNWVEGGYTYVVAGALPDDGLRRIATEVGARIKGGDGGAQADPT